MLTRGSRIRLGSFRNSGLKLDDVDEARSRGCEEVSMDWPEGRLTALPVFPRLGPPKCCDHVPAGTPVAFTTIEGVHAPLSFGKGEI